MRPSILLASDASPDALGAARLLADLPLPAETRLGVLHVEMPLPAVAGLPREFIDEIERAAAEAARACIERSLAVLGPRAATTIRLSRRGPPSAVIIDAAEELGSDLVVVGARGENPMPTSLLGSVAQDVTRHAPCSVLIFRSTAVARDRRVVPARVLLAVDSSPHAAAAARFLEWLPLPLETEFHVVSIVQRYEPQGAAPAADSPLAGALAAIRREGWAAATHAAAEVHSWLCARGWRADEPHVGEGYPAAEILRRAAEIAADLIVVGWRGTRPGQGVLLGTTARKVVRYAACSVLVVKERPTGGPFHGGH